MRLNEPRRGTAPFNFALVDLPGVDTCRVYVVNRLCRLVSHAGLALLVRLLEANLVNAGYQSKVRKRQHRRLEEHDRDDFEFRVVMTALTNMEVKRAIDAICDYLF